MDYASIPTDIHRLHRNVGLDINVLYVNNIPFLVSQAKNIMCATLERILNCTKKCGFVSHSIAMDGEFECLMTDMARIGVTGNPTAKGEHVPGIERQNRVTKEQA
eukprot:6263660-Ditylum_brightwellii.AAC.1